MCRSQEGQGEMEQELRQFFTKEVQSIAQRRLGTTSPIPSCADLESSLRNSCAILLERTLWVDVIAVMYALRNANADFVMITVTLL